jgi:uncharacterized membrane protein
MICSYCDAPMPDVSAFCPACGRSTTPEAFATTQTRDRVLGVLSYFTLLPAIVFLLLPTFRESHTVRFHAWQSVLFSISCLILVAVLRILFFIFSFFPLLAWLFSGVGVLGIVILWLVLVVKAAQGHGFEVPLIGPLAARLSSH